MLESPTNFEISFEDAKHGYWINLLAYCTYMKKYNIRHYDLHNECLFFFAISINKFSLNFITNRKIFFCCFCVGAYKSHTSTLS